MAFDSSCGIDPVKRLKSRSSSRRLVRLPSDVGSVPPILPFSNLRTSNLYRCEISVGICPARSLSSAHNVDESGRSRMKK